MNAISSLIAAGAFAGRAAAAGGVEGEARGGVSTNLGLGQRREELADQIEDAEVGGGRGARCLADGRLVDLDDGLEAARAAELVEGRSVDSRRCRRRW